MKYLIAAAAFIALSLAQSQAQQPATAPAAPAAPGAPAGTTGEKGNFSECRAMLKGRNLTKDGRQAFMRECTRDVVAACRAKVANEKLTAAERRNAIRSCAGAPPKPEKS